MKTQNQEKRFLEENIKEILKWKHRERFFPFFP